MRRGRLVAIAVAAGVAAACCTGAASASAAPDFGVSPPTYKVIDKKTLSTSYVNKSDEIGSCTTHASGTTCTITESTSATVSIQTSLGYSRDGVAAGLNITNSSTVATSVGCTSPKMNSGQVFGAWPKGTRYSYKIEEDGAFGQKTSGTLYAFVPKKNAIDCDFE